MPIYDFESALTGYRQENDKCYETLQSLGKNVFSNEKSLSSQIAQFVRCPLRGTGGHGFDPGPRHTKVVKNGTSCSSLGTLWGRARTGPPSVRIM